MRAVSLILLFASAPALAGGPMLTTSGACPGLIDIDAMGLSPDSQIVVLFGTEPGSSAIPIGACAGTPTALDDLRFGTRARTDLSGAVSFSVDVPAEACGYSIQILDKATCTLTNAVAVGGDGCDPGFAGAFVFPEGAGTGPRPIAAGASEWLAFECTWPNHQIYATNEDDSVDLQLDIWYPSDDFAGCDPADYSYDDVGVGMGLDEEHNSDLWEPIPDGTVWIRVTNLAGVDGTFSVFDSD